ncbi:MAG: pilus assembly protein TadG-related protein, partial [Bryobacteraceae bacterium]
MMDGRLRKAVSIRRRTRQKGMVMIVMAAASIAIIGVLGVAVDMGRIFIAKNETQTYCDAGALAAALKLDGTTTGINNAIAAVSGTGDAWNLGTTAVPAPTIEFATSGAGPWLANPAPATGYAHVRVTANVSVPTYFAPILTGSTSMTVQSRGMAAQVVQTSLSVGLAPYTAVASDIASPTYGLTVGQEYDIQWPASNSHGFIRPLCTGDQAPARQAAINSVLNVWGSQTNGYWGSNSNAVIRAEVLDLIQQQPATIGQT